MSYSIKFMRYNFFVILLFLSGFPSFSKKKEKSKISDDRIFILFFSFICLIAAFLIKISTLSFQEPAFSSKNKLEDYFSPIRRDIVDRNGDLISRNVKSYHAAVRSNMIKDKKNLH